MKALIYGISGQDGSFLSEILLEKGYEVVGVVRRCSTDNTQNINHLLQKIKLIEGDITDAFNVSNTINQEEPDEIYNLAAQSHVGTSFKQPNLTWDITAGGALNILEAIRYSPRKDDIKFYQASSSEMFGKNYTSDIKRGFVCDDTNLKYQDEDTAFVPQSPYAIAKLAAHHLVRNYRDSYDIHGSCGILFNHESERRGENFVTRKITKWIGEFKKWAMDIGYLGSAEFNGNELILSPDGSTFPKLRLGNLDAYRDWGYAGDYCEAMWMMLQQDESDDYVICTGKTHTVRYFLDIAFSNVGIDNWSNYVVVDPEFYRPAEVDYLRGDCSKAQEKLGWKAKTSFESLVKIMVDNDVKEERLQRPCLQTVKD